MVFRTFKLVCRTTVAIVATIIYSVFSGNSQRYGFDDNGFSDVKQIEYKKETRK